MNSNTFTDIRKLSKLLFIGHVFGNTFTYFKNVSVVLMRYVYGEDKKEEMREDELLGRFKAESETLMTMIPRTTNSFENEFR
jgi:hypothetical protein